MKFRQILYHQGSFGGYIGIIRPGMKIIIDIVDNKANSFAHQQTIEEFHYVRAKESVSNIDVLILKRQMATYVQGRLCTVQFTDENHVWRYKRLLLPAALKP